MKQYIILRRCAGATTFAAGSLAALFFVLAFLSAPANAAGPTRAATPAPVPPAGTSFAGLPTVQQPGGGGEEEVRNGMVVATPATFAGNWVILLASGVTQTVVVDAATDVYEFEGHLPPSGVWVKARGTLRTDGALLATRLRPDEFEDGQVVVRFNQVMNGQELHNFSEQHHLKLLSELLASANIYLFAVEDEQNSLPPLQADARVHWAELNYVNGIPNNPAGNPFRSWEWGGQDDSGYVNQGAYGQVNLAPAQAQYQGNGVIVAILDTGIDLTHPAFQGRLLAGRDMVADDLTPQDECCGVGQGHGTHVAGIVARIAPQSQLLPIRVLDPNGRGNTFVLAYAIEWAAEQGADVINLSLGADFGSTVLSETIASAIGQGIVVVAAAGNNDGAAPQYPAAYPNVVGVTALTADNTKAVFAGYGATWVDLAAPGVGITSTIVGPQGSGYAVWSGTSMATPFVSGAAALAREKLPTATAGELATRLSAYGADIDAYNPPYAGQLGRLLDIGAALVEEAPTGYRLFLPSVVRN